MLKIDKDTHRIEGVEFYDSCNHDERPFDAVIDTIIVHCISLPLGEYDNDNIVDLFLNKLDTSKHKSFSDLSNLKVSSHLLIKRKGDIFNSYLSIFAHGMQVNHVTIIERILMIFRLG